MEKNKYDIMKMLSPEMIQVIQKQKQLNESIFATSGTMVDKYRESYFLERKFWNENKEEIQKVVNEQVDTTYGKVNVRIFYPVDNPLNNVIFFNHGGGFVVGDLDTHDNIMRLISKNSGSVVIGIDYYLSPEYKYPVAINQCVEVIKYFRENSDKYKIDKDNVVIAGDSAGANISLSACLKFRDDEKDNSFIKALLLYYGGYGLEDSVSKRLLGNELDGLTEQDFKYYTNLYLGDNYSYDDVSLFKNDLSYGIPPSYILCSNVDPLRDDSILLNEILTAKGVETKFLTSEGLLHGFLHYSRMIPEVIDIIEESCDFANKFLK